MTPKIPQNCKEHLKELGGPWSEPEDDSKTWQRTKYQTPGPGGDCSAFKGPFNPYQVHRMPAVADTTAKAVAYTANTGVTRRSRWSRGLRATTEICQDCPGSPKTQTRGESPRVLPRPHHVHIQESGPE